MNCAFQRVLDTLKIESLRDLQPEALEKLVNGQDVFVIQPVWKVIDFSVRSNCFRHSVRGLYLMQSRWHLSFLPWFHSWKTYQVRFLKSVGISAEFIGEEQRNEEAKQRIELGECQVVFGSPEAFLSSTGWRSNYAEQ